MTQERQALVMVDPQVDFCPGGNLAVKDGDQVMERLNAAKQKIESKGGDIYVSRDWHDANNTEHMNPNKWPLHCIEDTPGAAFHPALDTNGATVISKGMGLKDDGYSSFDGVAPDGDSLAAKLRERRIKKIFVGGLATDYCVRATVLDGIKLGFNVVVLLDAIKAVNLQPEDGDKALSEMKEAGATLSIVSQI